jgi:hypothetical protein
MVYQTSGVQMIKKIKVGAVTYSIKYLPDTIRDQYGACVFEHQIIYLSKQQQYEGAADTLLHEVLHAIWNEAGLEMAPALEQETVVRTLATWMRIVIVDNPEFYKFLKDGKDIWPYGPKTDPLKEAIE